MSDLTFRMIHKQLLNQNIGIREGHGSIRRAYDNYGPFVVYSRISPETVLNIVQSYIPSIKSLTEMKTIFLLGPTPRFFGENRATTSWRRDFLEYITKRYKSGKSLSDRYLIVLPEPYDCDWKSVDYASITEPIDHIYAQVHWENYFIDLAVKTGVLVLNAHFMWKGNAGPTTRFEAGKLFSLMQENKLNAAVINCPKESQAAQYIMSHLIHALPMYNNGRFIFTQCSPLNLNKDGVPIDKDNNIVEAGLYPDGSIERGNLDIFYGEIFNIANKL